VSRRLRFPSVLLQPLGHFSVSRINGLTGASGSDHLKIVSDFLMFCDQLRPTRGTDKNDRLGPEPSHTFGSTGASTGPVRHLCTGVPELLFAGATCAGQFPSRSFATSGQWARDSFESRQEPTHSPARAQRHNMGSSRSFRHGKGWTDSGRDSFGEIRFRRGIGSTEPLLVAARLIQA
jgi:hypothetical protein